MTDEKLDQGDRYEFIKRIEELERFKVNVEDWFEMYEREISKEIAELKTNNNMLHGKLNRYLKINADEWRKLRDEVALVKAELTQLIYKVEYLDDEAEYINYDYMRKRLSGEKESFRHDYEKIACEAKIGKETSLRNGDSKPAELSEYQKQRNIFIETHKDHPCDVCIRKCEWAHYPKDCSWYIQPNEKPAEPIFVSEPYNWDGIIIRQEEKNKKPEEPLWLNKSRKEMMKKFNMTDHGDHPKLFEYDPKNAIVDVFVYKDPDCPYPFTITNTEDIWYHQGFYLKEFIAILDVFLQKNDLPYKIVELK